MSGGIAGTGAGLAPDFLLPDQGLTATPFYDRVCGRPVLLLFVARIAEAGDWLDRLAGLAADLHVFVVSRDSLDANRDAAEGRGLPFPLLTDPGGRVAALYGIDADLAWRACAPDLRIVAAGAGAPPEAFGDVLGTALGDAAPVAAEIPPGHRHAPVLVLPDLVPPALRDALVAAWRNGNPRPTGVRAAADGGYTTATNRLDASLKRRRDLVVTDAGLLEGLETMLRTRLGPETARAFGSEADAVEQWKIAGYDAADQGFFAAHRDNTAPATAERRFALTLALNGPDAYAGGALAFPEFGTRYRPAAGTGIVFSGGLLHAAEPVTSGLRLVLLAFLLDDRSDARKAARTRWFDAEAEALERAFNP